MFFLGDEGDEDATGSNTKTFVFDVSDLTAPILSYTYIHKGRAVDHNMYSRGSLLFQANYASGMRVLEVSADSLAEIGYFDSSEAPATQMTGAWSVYPYFGKGKVIISGDEGIHIVQLNQSLTNLADGITTITSTKATTTTTSTAAETLEIVSCPTEVYGHQGYSFVVTIKYSSGGDSDGIVLKLSFKALDGSSSIARLISIQPGNGVSVNVTMNVKAAGLNSASQHKLLAYITTTTDKRYIARLSGDIKTGITVLDETTTTTTSFSETPADRTIAAELASPMSCSELGWTPNSNGVCASSVLNGHCFNSGDIDHTWATRLCELFNARLCTIAELESGVAKGTGCMLDNAEVWTSNECSPGVFTTALGGNGSRQACVAGTAASFDVRCCADDVASGMRPDPESTAGPSTDDPMPPAGQPALSEKPCADLGSAFQMGISSPSVPSSRDVCCAATTANGICLESMTFDDAKAFCEAGGARLCTLTELQNNECANRGCQYNSKFGWSTDTCDGGYMTATNKFYSGKPPVCVADTEERIGSCCADVFSTSARLAAPEEKPSDDGDEQYLAYGEVEADQEQEGKTNGDRNSESSISAAIGTSVGITISVAVVAVVAVHRRAASTALRAAATNAMMSEGNMPDVRWDPASTMGSHHFYPEIAGNEPHTAAISGAPDTLEKYLDVRNIPSGLSKSDAQIVVGI